MSNPDERRFEQLDEYVAPMADEMADEIRRLAVQLAGEGADSAGR